MVNNTLIDDMRLDGGVLCLDFVNTIPDRVDGTNRDSLKNFNDLIYWAKKTGILDVASFTAFERIGESKQKKAKDFYSEAVKLRSLIYSMFHAVSKKQGIKPRDLEQFNMITNEYFLHLEIVSKKDGYEERWNIADDSFQRVTAPIVKAAYDLLLSDKTARVKECPNCGWLFLDTTKNGRRRWCSMDDCGSVVKALEYYYRHKK